MNQPLLLFSKLELLFKGLGQSVFSSVLHLQGPHHGLLGQISLHLNFRVLFPGSDTLWHVELNLFLQEDVHLLLYWVHLACYHESSGVVDTGHLVEIFMWVSVAAHHVELSVEDVFSVASILHSIIDNQLDHDFFGLLTVEGQVFSIARDNVSVLS